MTSKRCIEEIKFEAVKQVTERGYSVAEVAERLGTSPSCTPDGERCETDSPGGQQADDKAEIAKLKSVFQNICCSDQLNPHLEAVVSILKLRAIKSPHQEG